MVSETVMGWPAAGGGGQEARPFSAQNAGAERQHAKRKHANDATTVPFALIFTVSSTILPKPRVNAVMPVSLRTPHLLTATAWPWPRFPELSATPETRSDASFIFVPFGVYGAKMYKARMFPSNHRFQDG